MFPARAGASVELGPEPPLARDGERGAHDRRSISLRWLSGTVLTGLLGAGLIGAAIFIALDGELTFAERAEQASTSVSRAASVDRSPKRGDKLFVSADIVSAKQAFRTPTTIRVGDREVIKVKPFVRVATNLALGSLGFADDVPPFNPMKMYGNDTAEKAPEPETTEGDAEVSVQKKPLAGYADAPDSGAVLSQAQVEAQIGEERKAALFVGQRPNVPLSSQLMLTRALTAASALQPDAPPAPIGTAFSTMQVTFSTENVTVKEKSPPQEKQAAAAPTSEERMVTVRRGETFESVLRGNGAGPNEVRSIVAALAGRLKESPVREGGRLKLLFGPSSDGRRTLQLLRVMVMDGDTITAIAAVDDRNAFVSVAPPLTESPATADEDEEDDTDEANGGLRLFDSIYETGFKHDIPRNVLDTIIKVAFYDFDLQRRVSGGDTFEVFYAEDEENEGRPDVLFASLSVGGLTKRYYRFQLNDDVIDYFDDTGKSNRKFLIRKPIAEGILRSTYGMRYHPIMRYSRMHTGIDWANRIGTPIIAAGDGRVKLAGWESGYGRRVEIEHAYNFTTTYNHMSGFARGIREGVRVRQGQVIGYLGSTGLSTGPHLHYEVLINGNFVDPLSVKVPRSRDLDAQQLLAFKRERERIDELISKAPTATRLAERAR
ncbi:M23 family metallopeptidase [Alsobacter sp. SYSU M60028]|uniref:M23 family metallopeptidase n=1 Tax=Alsobacter ponti TaxID=2962936 RepID=A0ABT1LJ21_9HYPH|nr:M23 family metallopeptidase [Alsobacter ponti]MCP8941126.1 M23 family metallopeptidase [Alsobacter ponti]